MVKIGIDNGVSGSVAIIDGESVIYVPTPVFRSRNYTKKEGYTNRIDVKKLTDLLKPYSGEGVVVKLERPMINSGRFFSTISAARSLEATLITLEMLDFEYVFVDSKSWQKKYLPKGVKGSEALKEASKEAGKALYPELSDAIDKQKDADGIFIALLDDW